MSTVWKRRLLLLGVIVPILQNFILIADALTRPGFNPLRHWISHQSLGERGWVGTGCLLLSGLLICAYAVGLRQSLRSGKGSVWGPMLIGIYGMGLILAVVFPIDPGLDWPPGVPAERSASGSVHDMAGAMVFGSLTAVCFVLSRRNHNDPEWKGWRMYSIVSGITIFAAFAVCSVLVSLDYAKVMPEAPSGLFERISFAAGGLWILLLTVKLLRTENPAQRSISM